MEDSRPGERTLDRVTHRAHAPITIVEISKRPPKKKNFHVLTSSVLANVVRN